MSITSIIRLLSLVVLCLSVTTLKAQEITLQHQGLTLNADLKLAEGKTLADGVVLITHGALAHRDMELLVYLRALFRERGYSSLAINLSLGIDNRHGMFDCMQTQRHRNGDAVVEIGRWMGWLESQGVQDVILLGHSRGGAQTAQYAMEGKNSLVRAVVLMAPATRENTDAESYRKRYQQSLMPLLQKARHMLATQQGDAVLGTTGLLTCRETPVTAATFVSYYGQSPSLDTPSLLPSIPVPTLVVVAGADRVVENLGSKLARLIDGKRLQMKVVEGSDHLFRDLNTDDAVDAIDAFLQDTLG